MPINLIDAATLARWLERNEASVVDVREPAEYAGGHIPGAVLLPMGDACCGRLPRPVNRKLVVHCHSGRRGDAVCQSLLKEDPNLELYHLAGGIAAWQAAGFEVESSAIGGHILPLDRQVHLIVGICVLLGSWLAYAVSPVFLFLTGFMGTGLLLDGLTGFCGLGRVLARMPWNQRATQATHYGAST